MAGQLVTFDRDGKVQRGVILNGGQHPNLLKESKVIVTLLNEDFEIEENEGKPSRVVKSIGKLNKIGYID